MWTPPLDGTSGQVACLAVVIALALDRWLGEPPARWHPVVAMGACLSWAGHRIAPPRHTPDGAAEAARAFVGGALAWCLMAAVWAVLAATAVWLLRPWPWWAQALVLGVLLKPMLSWRMLRDEVRAVEAALAVSLPAGRERLARLVSRDVDQLEAHTVRESAIETLAENLNDSVVAPLFWFAVAGLPGAVLYRFANTADAMWGYPGQRGGRDWQWAGKWAARADDVLSWLPARLTALLLALAAGGGQHRRWWTLPAEAAVTPSPNGGWPMAAMALALGVRLSKPGVYALNPGGRPPAPVDTALALRWSGRVVFTLVSGALAGAAVAIVQM